MKKSSMKKSLISTFKLWMDTEELFCLKEEQEELDEEEEEEEVDDEKLEELIELPSGAYCIEELSS